MHILPFWCGSPHMFVLVTYDVSTTSSEGRARLRRVATVCLDYGQRVQNSVFEMNIPADKWQHLRAELLDEIDADEDSVRFYFLGRRWRRRIEHHGIDHSEDFEGPLIV